MDLTQEMRAYLRRLAALVPAGPREVTTYDAGQPYGTHAVYAPPDGSGFRWSNAYPTRSQAEYAAAVTNPALVIALLDALEANERRVYELQEGGGGLFP